MRLNVTDRPPWDLEPDVPAITVPAADEPPEHLRELDRRLEGALSAMRDVGAIRGSRWETRLIAARQMGARFVLAVFIDDFPFDALVRPRHALHGINTGRQRVELLVHHGRHVSGQPYRNQYHFLMRIRDGRISEFKEYLDTQLAARVLLGQP